MKQRLKPQFDLIFAEMRKIGVGLVLAGLVGTLIQNVSYLFGLASILLGIIFVLVGSLTANAKEE